MEKKEQRIKEQKILEKILGVLFVINLIFCLMMKFVSGDKVIIVAIVLGVIWILMMLLIYALNDNYYNIYLDPEEHKINIKKNKLQIIIALFYSIFIVIWMFNCFK